VLGRFKGEGFKGEGKVFKGEGFLGEGKGLLGRFKGEGFLGEGFKREGFKGEVLGEGERVVEEPSSFPFPTTVPEALPSSPGPLSSGVHKSQMKKHITINTP